MELNITKGFFQKTLFLSYCSYDTVIADMIEKSLIAQVGSIVRISRFTRDLGYRKSFKDFMNEISRHDFVLTIVSDKYLKSEACMYEVGEILKDHSYKDRLLFVVLSEKEVQYYSGKNIDVKADIYNHAGQISYIEYWEKRYEEVKIEMQRIKSEEARIESREKLRELKKIIDFDLRQFMKHLSDANGKSFEMLKSEGFLDIILCLHPTFVVSSSLDTNRKSKKKRLVGPSDNLSIEAYDLLKQAIKTCTCDTVHSNCREIIKDFFDKLRRCKTEKEYSDILDTLKLGDNLTYWIGSVPEFNEFIFLTIREDVFSFAMKETVLKTLNRIYTEDSIMYFEAVAGDEFILDFVNDSYKTMSPLLLMAINLCRYKYKDSRYKTIIFYMLMDSLNRYDIRTACIKCLTYGTDEDDSSGEVNLNILETLKREYINKNSFLPIESIIKIAVFNSIGDDTFDFLANVFFESDDIETKKYIIGQISSFLQESAYRPSLRRKYREITMEVCQWNDEVVTGDWLAYCLCVMDERLLSVEEILDLIRSINNDCFESFVEGLWNIWPFVSYNMKPIDTDDIKALIKERKHPREKYLLLELEHIS